MDLRFWNKVLNPFYLQLFIINVKIFIQKYNKNGGKIWKKIKMPDTFVIIFFVVILHHYWLI